MAVEINADIRRNRVVCILGGTFNDVETARELQRLYLSEARKLRPPFDAVTDISEFRTNSEGFLKILAETQGELKKLGLNRVARIVGRDTVVPKMQFGRSSRSVGYQAESHVHSIEEAHALLDAMELRPEKAE